MNNLKLFDLAQWNLWRRFHDVCVSTPDGKRPKPSGHHSWKVERSNAEEDTKRLLDDHLIDTGCNVFGIIPHLKRRNTCGTL